LWLVTVLSERRGVETSRTHDQMPAPKRKGGAIRPTSKGSLEIGVGGKERAGFSGLGKGLRGNRRIVSRTGMRSGPLNYSKGKEKERGGKFLL